MHAHAPANPWYGVLAEFRSPEDLLHAVRKTKAAGFKKFDAFMPYPIEAILHEMPYKSRVPLICLLGAIAGMAGVFGLATWVSVIEYPLNIGGRPFFSWPAFVPVTFEGAVLIGGLSTAIGMILINGLPRPHHPLFGVPRFVAAASKDRYFLCIEAEDPRFEKQAVRDFLSSLNAADVTDVEND